MVLLFAKDAVSQKLDIYAFFTRSIAKFATEAIRDAAYILAEVDLASLEQHIVKLFKWNARPILYFRSENLHETTLND